MANVPPYNPRMKYYTRLDGSGNPISGTNVARLKMPKTGSWREIDGNTCCFPYTSMTYTPADVTSDEFTVIILCSASEMLSVQVILEVDTTTIEELVDALNAQLSYLGQFSVDGDAIDLKLKLSVSEGWLCDGDLTFTVIPT